MRYFIGDVRDYNRLKRAMDGVDVVIHSAALKQKFSKISSLNLQIVNTYAYYLLIILSC